MGLKGGGGVGVIPPFNPSLDWFEAGFNSRKASMNSPTVDIPYLAFESWQVINRIMLYYVLSQSKLKSIPRSLRLS